MTTDQEVAMRKLVNAAEAAEAVLVSGPITEQVRREASQRLGDGIMAIRRAFPSLK